MEILCKACGTIVDLETNAVHHLRVCTGYSADKREKHATDVAADVKRRVELFIHNAPDRLPQFTTPKNEGEAKRWAFPYKREALLKAIFKTAVRRGARIAFAELFFNLDRLSDYDHTDLVTRLEYTDFTATPLVFYRKMSNGEYGKIKMAGSSPHTPAFEYTKTKNYRWWISTSLDKVRAFGNEKASDSGERIIKITFNQSPRDKFSLKPHQMTGVQTDPRTVALHLEGFAERGPFDSATAMDEVFEDGVRHHNLGFTSDHATDLTRYIEKLETIQ